jgi:dipeptidyl-peptidase-4
VSWSADGQSVEYTDAGKRYRFDVGTKKSTELGVRDRHAEWWSRRARRWRTARRVADSSTFAIAPAGNHRAIYKDRNVWVGDSTGAGAVQITTDGSEKSRVKYGTASWVYGEELSQRTAMWWSPDGKKLAFYRFDESKVPDFYLATGLTRIQDSLDVEAYPKPGVSNPIVDLLVYDVDTKKTTRIDVRDGKPFDNVAIGHYVFRIDWAPGGKELTLLRTNRRQNMMDFAACNPSTGSCRVVIHEEWPTGWIDDDPAPTVTWLKDGNRFIWESDRTGFKNFYLYDFNAAKLITPLTQLPAEVIGIVRVDEASNTDSLHGARRRELHEGAVAPRRTRRKERQAADRPGVHAHDLAVARREAFHGRRRDTRSRAGHAHCRCERNSRERDRKDRSHEVQ